MFILQPVTLAEVLSGGLGDISGTNYELVHIFLLTVKALGVTL